MSEPNPAGDRDVDTVAKRGTLRDLILGWQDGLVNVLALVLGVATATNSIRIVLIAGLTGALAESISMAAVAYTSSKAARDYYDRHLLNEHREIDEIPEIEAEEIRTIYARKGFSGDLLEAVTKKITSNRKVWVETMMAEELRLSPSDYSRPVRSGLIVGAAAVLGSIIPLVPFVVLPLFEGIIASIVVSAAVLFLGGGLKAKFTVGDWKKSGLEMLAVGTGAALVGYVIGKLLGTNGIL